MSLPAPAFAERAPLDGTQGQLFTLRGHWALRVELQSSQTQAGQRWTIELHHKDRPFQSLGTIATIDRTAPAM